MTIQEAKHISRIDYVSGFFISLRQSYETMRNTLGEIEARKGYDRCIFRLVDDYLSAATEGFISETDFISLMNAVNDWKTANDEFFARGDDDTKSEPANLACKTEARGDYKECADYRLGCVFMPENINSYPLLAPRGLFIAPTTVDLRDYCTRTQDQGPLPWCAAFAAAGFAANINWRKNDSPMMYAPGPIYEYAKSHDGMPNADGTSLIAVLEALAENGIFDKNKVGVKVLRTEEQVRYAVHKFGCCLVGLNITKEWYCCNKNKSTISRKRDNMQIGGHAVLVCGYNKDGVIIQNSWDVDWGAYGFALITWEEFEREFMYGAVLDNCLYDTRMN